MTELSNTEADNQEEEVPQAMPAEDTPQETQSKNKRKRKAQNKKQQEGEEGLFSYHCWLHCTFFLISNLII